jgi:hypothetical protein
MDLELVLDLVRRSTVFLATAKSRTLQLLAFYE